MIFCGLESPELHLERVAIRVSHQGHDIPENKVRERWNASRLNLVRLLPHLSRLQVWDNSQTVEAGHDIPDPMLVLEIDEQHRVVVPDLRDVEAQAAVPAWAQPILEAAIQQQG